MAAKVFFIDAKGREGNEVISKKAERLFDAGGFASCFKAGDFTAVKVHIGEDKNTTYIKAPCLKGLVDRLRKLGTKPFLTDTSTLYTGRRHNGIDHTILANEHGFGMAGLGTPFICPDGLFGTSETPVRIDGPLNREVMIAYDIVRCQSILSIAHMTGHLATCAAASIKTLGMGCASRKGKMRQHASLKPGVSDKCVLCGVCVEYCPENAITLGPAQAIIDPAHCVGCAECVAMCRFDAIKYDWGAENAALQKNMAEHALGAVKGKQKRSAFFNFVISVTADCDCFGVKDMAGIVEDIGIFASVDPVAADKAAIDAIEQKTGRQLAKLIGNDKLDYLPQLEHAEKIGLGTTNYKLEKI